MYYYLYNSKLIKQAGRSLITYLVVVVPLNASRDCDDANKLNKTHFGRQLLWQAADEERNNADCEGILKRPSSSCGKKRQRVEEGDHQRDQFSCIKKAELAIELKKRGQAANTGQNRDILLERLRQRVQTQSDQTQHPGGGRTAGATSRGGLAAAAAANPADKASTVQERTFKGGPRSKKQRNATTGVPAVGGIRQMGGRTPPTSNCGGCYSAAAGTRIVEPCGHHCCEGCIARWGPCLLRGAVCPVPTCRQTYTTVRLIPIR